MARVIVTGGAGFVGLPLSLSLSAAGHEVTVIDDLTCGTARAEQLGSVRLEKIDVRDAVAVQASILRARPDLVLHLAALHFIPECNRRPVDTIEINVVGTANVLAGCRTARPSRVVVTSSAAVYPISDKYMGEDDAVGPTDVYGLSKAVNEQQAARFHAETGIDAVAVRLYNVYGPGETNPHVVPEIISQMKTGDDLRLGNTAARRCYIHVDDVVSGFMAVATSPAVHGSVVVNLGVREEASVDDMLDTLRVVTGRPLRVIADPARQRPSDRAFLRCDPSRMEALTGWRPRHVMSSGLAELARSEGVMGTGLRAGTDRAHSR